MFKRIVGVIIFLFCLSSIGYSQSPVGYVMIAKSAIVFGEVEDGTSQTASWGDRLVVASISGSTAKVVFPSGTIASCSTSDLYMGQTLTMKDLEARVGIANDLFEAAQKERGSDVFVGSMKEWGSYIALYARRLGESSPANLPHPQESNSGDESSNPTNKLTNDTKYKLVVTFVGPITVVKKLPPRGDAVIELKPGEYKVVVTVPGSHVIPFHGVHRFKVGYTYTDKFYIVTESR